MAKPIAVTGRGKMDDLISRQALMKEFSDFVRESNNSDFAPTPTWNDAVSLVESMPSAERRGRWEKIELSAPSGDYVMFQCSECASLYYEPSSYCPNCGSFNGKDNLNEKL